MAAFSRRQLARYAADQLLAGRNAKNISAHLAAALITSKMQAQADLLLDDIAEELEVRGTLARAIAISANGLSAQLKKDLSAQIKKAAKVNEVSLSERVDPDVIGGVRIETARYTWDKTIARKLAEIKGGI